MLIRWSRLGIPLCAINRHAPLRARAHWNGRTYSAECRYCGKPIERAGRSVWRREPQAPAS